MLGESFEIPGGACPALMEPWGANKTLKGHLLFCFEHLEVLWGSLGILLGPWGLLWEASGGPGGALERP